MRPHTLVPRILLLVSVAAFVGCDTPTDAIEALEPQFAKGGKPGGPGGDPDPSSYTLTALDDDGSFSAISATGILVGAVHGDDYQATAWDPTLQGFPLPSAGGYSYAHAINPSGSRVVGDADGLLPHFWDVSGTTVVAHGALALLPGKTEGQPHGVNDLGQIVGSNRDDGPAPGNLSAVLWDASGTPTELATLPGGVGANAAAINASGHVVGKAFFNTLPDWPRAVLWLIDGTSVSVVDLSADSDESGDNGARAVSEVVDGVVFVGGTTSLGGQRFATVWTVDASTGVVLDVARRSDLAEVRGITTSGLAVTYDAAVWDVTSDTVEPLPDLSSRCNSLAHDISEAGVVVGRSGVRQRGSCVYVPTIWTPVAP